MVQAAKLTKHQRYDNEIILLLLHDVGHLCALKDEHQSMGAYGIIDHDVLELNIKRKWVL